MEKRNGYNDGSKCTDTPIMVITNEAASNLKLSGLLFGTSLIILIMTIKLSYLGYSLSLGYSWNAKESTLFSFFWRIEINQPQSGNTGFLFSSWSLWKVFIHRLWYKILFLGYHIFWYCYENTLIMLFYWKSGNFFIGIFCIKQWQKYYFVEYTLIN